MGFAWSQSVNYLEAIPTGGLLRIGDFARKTALATTLTLLETEGKAQTIMNPKIIVRSGDSDPAELGVGTSIPIQQCTLQGCSVQQLPAKTNLQVLAQVMDEKKGTIDVRIKLIVANFGSQTFPVAGAAVPSVDERAMTTGVTMRSGETLVLSGFKSTSKSVTIQRVPFLGRIPLLGALFTSKDVKERDETLFVFLTLEIVK